MTVSSNIPLAPHSAPRSRLFLPILAGGAAAGTFDITSAFITFGWGAACRGVAGGLLGPAALRGGIGTWLLGLFLHFTIATTIAAVYCITSRRLIFLREHFFVCGLFYGMAAWLVMNLIVLPLSAYHARGPYQLHAMIQGIEVHMFLIGLPISYINSKLSSSGGPVRGLTGVNTKRMTGIACVLFLAVSAGYAAETVQYPDDFPRWVHVSTGVVLAGADSRLMREEGMHHIFANAKAAEGYPTGNFPDGSIIVYELREIEQKDGVIRESQRKRVDVMIKDSAQYKDTGGWRFERFWGNDQTQDALHGSGTTCFACHSKANTHGSVFSQLR